LADIAAWAARRLFASELALTGNSLVRFGDALDPVLELAIPLWQLLGDQVAAADWAFDIAGPRLARYNVACVLLAT